MTKMNIKERRISRILEKVSYTLGRGISDNFLL